MDEDQINYALAKQIPLGSEKITLETNYGSLVLEGSAGRKAVKALRMILNIQLKESSK